jgi:Tfp pilus assembly protein FimT
MEMLAVVAVLGVAAALAIPQASSVPPAVADAAAAEVGHALRFAQGEAIRTGSFYLVRIDPATQMLKVVRPTSSGDVTAIHPIDKTAYQISFNGNGMARGTIVSSVFKYDKTALTYASFGPDGSPGDMHTPLDPTKIDSLKEDGKITIRYGNVERVISVAPVTGRVTL